MRHVPRKRFGQHFLTDRSVLGRIVEAVKPSSGQNLVEIGPGEGALTGLLLQRCDRMQAIEIDRDLVASLGARFSEQALLLHQADVLEFDLAMLGERPRLVGNLPYNISTPLLFRIADEVPDVLDCHFMLQEEVVDRMAARPSTADYGRLSVMVQSRFRVEKLFTVPPEAFRPPPKVNSAVVRLTPLPSAALPVVDMTIFSFLVRSAFSLRRKMLRNALAGMLDDAELASLGVDPTLRPENLDVADYIRLARHVEARGRVSAPDRGPAGDVTSARAG